MPASHAFLFILGNFHFLMSNFCVDDATTQCRAYNAFYQLLFFPPTHNHWHITETNKQKQKRRLFLSDRLRRETFLVFPAIPFHYLSCALFSFNFFFFFAMEQRERKIKTAIQKANEKNLCFYLTQPLNWLQSRMEYGAAGAGSVEVKSMYSNLSNVEQFIHHFFSLLVLLILLHLAGANYMLNRARTLKHFTTQSAHCVLQ